MLIELDNRLNRLLEDVGIWVILPTSKEVADATIASAEQFGCSIYSCTRASIVKPFFFNKDSRLSQKWNL